MVKYSEKYVVTKAQVSLHPRVGGGGGGVIFKYIYVMVCVMRESNYNWQSHAP